MIKVQACPVCGCGGLRVLKTYHFTPPQQEQRDEASAEIAYECEMRWIFFNKIWKDGNVAHFEITLCNSCGLLFENPRFTDEEIILKYETISSLDSVRQRERARPPIKQELRAGRVFALTDPLLARSSGPRKILDYGGRDGCILIPFAAAGYDCALLDYQEYDLPDGIIRLGDDVGSLAGDARFDLILLSHVMEHLVRPAELLGALAARLAEGGLLYAEVPLGCFIEWETLGEPLTHVNFFSEESIFNCLRGGGLDVVHLSTAFQWLHRRRSWCINAVARKGPGAAQRVTAYKTTRRQMVGVPYYVPLLMRDPIYYSRRIAKKLLDRLSKPRTRGEQGRGQ